MNVSDQIVISFAWEDFEGPWLSRQFLMRQIADLANVLHITPEMRADQIVPKARIQGIRSIFPRLREITPSLIHLQPGGCFPRFYESHDWLNFLSLAGRVHVAGACLRRRGWTGSRALYIWNPDFHEYFGRTGESVSFFHCVDYYPDYWPAGSVDHANSLRNLEICLKKADVVFSVSSPIDKRLTEIVDRPITRLAHGVDYHRFADCAGEPAPPELAELPHPRLGHIGRINDKVDTNMLADIALARPTWSVVLLGPIVSDLDATTRAGLARLEALPNAHLFGGKPPLELPAYYHALDVGLLAYRLERWVPYSSPLKYMEFLAAGKPMVSADVEWLRGNDKRFVRCVSALPDWLDAIEAMFTEDSHEIQRLRKEFAAANTWKHRALEVLAHIRAREESGD